MEPDQSTDEDFRDAMQELRRKTRALHEVFPASNKAEQAIQRAQAEWAEKLKAEPEQDKASRMHDELKRTAELLREEIQPGRRVTKSNEMER